MIFTFVTVCLALLGIFLATIFWLTFENPKPGISPSQPIREFQNQKNFPNRSEPQVFRILSWNIGFGQGMGSDGIGYKPKSREEMEHTLRGIAKLLDDLKIDFALLQEVDFYSARSKYIDQAGFLATNTSLRFSATSVTWDVRYFPFPYWPPSQHYGRVQSGPAVLSRFPILGNIIYRHEKPQEEPWWYRKFYLSRFCQAVKILHPSLGKIDILNSHFDAYNRFNRKSQAEFVQQWILEFPDTLVFGGDFNTVPPPAKRKENLGHNPKDNYEDDATYRILANIPGFRDCISIADYAENESQYFSFPADMPDRKIDYLFARKDLSLVSAKDY